MARVLQLRRGTTAENNLFTGAVAEATYDTDRKELRVHDGSTVGGKVVSAPTGAVMAFAGSSAPEGWLVCDGSAVSRTTYADLFAVIGTTYGSGDGNTTFNLPEKYAYTGGVVGNGMTLGLSNGTSDGGLIQLGSTYRAAFKSTAYGEPIQQTNPNGDNLSSRGYYGLTTDPTKSGVEVVKDTMIVCIKY